MDTLSKVMMVGAALGIDIASFLPPTEEQTQADRVALEKAQAKRDRKAAKRSKYP